MIDIHVQSALNKVLCIEYIMQKKDERFQLLCRYVLAGFYEKGLQQRNLLTTVLSVSVCNACLTFKYNQI